MGRRRSTEWFELDFKGMPEAEFVANFRLSSCFVLPLSACSLYLSEETNKA